MTPVLSLEDQIEALRRGDRLVEELSADDVERLVVHAIKKDFPEYDVEDCTGHGGPIDVIIRRLSRSSRGSWGSTSAEESIYVECKHYTRKLELDTVAKVFVVAVVDKPNELIIVSSSALGPQAEQCAKYLFVQPQAPLSARRRPPMREPATVTGTLFRLVRLEDLLGIAPPARAKPQTRGGKVSWRLVEETPFWTRPLSPEDGTVKLSPSGIYRISLDTQPPTANAKCCGLILQVKRPNRPKRLLRMDGMPLDEDADGIAFSIRAAALIPTAPGERHELAVIIEWRDGAERLRTTVPLFKYRLARLLPALPDLRGTHGETVVADFVEDPAKRILLAHGEGGTGKTWLSNLAARKLHTMERAGCQALLVDDITSVEMLRTVAWNLMMPALPMPGGDVDLVAFSEHWLDGAAKSRLAQNHRSAFRELLDVNGVAGADAVEGGADVAGLALALAVLLVHSPVPQVLIFRDCHRASAGFTRVLKHLLLSLSNLGWGKTRIILEYRDDDEANGNWLAFVEADLPVLAHVVVDAPLSPVGCDDIETALSAVTAGGHCGPLAHAVFEKTRGNPLLVHHLLLHFAEKGYIVPVDDRVMRMRVASFGDIVHELAHDIGFPNDVLPARIQHLIGALPADQREPALLYLTGAAFSETQYEEDLFAAACADGADARKVVRHWLMDCEVIEPAADGDRLQFIHDFMRLAVREVLTRHADFRRLGQGVLDGLPSDTVPAHITAGDLLTALRRPSEAFRRFDAGQELARALGLLLLRERCLAGARDALEAVPSQDAGVVERRAAIGLAFAGTLTQTGSQIRALDALMRVRRLLETDRARYLLPAPKRGLFASSVVRQRLTLLVRMMKGEEFFGEFGDCANHRLASEDVHYALTRYALMATHCHQTEAAWRALPYAIATCPPDGDAPASLHSDLGRLYLQADPPTARDHWEQAMALAKSRRQITHSSLNLLVAALYLGSEPPSGRDLDALEENLCEQGIANQLYRLWNCRGILAASEGKIGLAREYFERALSQSQSTDQPYWQWKSHNNLAVCLAHGGQRKDAENHLLAALSLTASFAAVSQFPAQRIIEPLTRVVAEHRLTSRTDLLRTLAAPASSGLFPVAFRNASTLQRTGGADADFPGWRFPPAGQCPLWLDACGILLAFAVE